MQKTQTLGVQQSS